MVGYALPETPLDITQKARVLWQSLSLLSQCSEHVTIPHNFRIYVCALHACACVVSRVNGTDIRTSCLSHPLIVVIMAGLNACGLQSKLLITPLSE